MKKKELAWIIISIIIFEFIILFPIPQDFNIILLLVPISIIIVNVFAKKIACEFFNIKIEHKIWNIERFWFSRDSHLKKPFPIGLIFSIIMSIISLGIIRIFLFLEFDAENYREKRMLKQRGSKRKQEINDSDLGFTAAWGFISLLLLSLIGLIIGYNDLAKYSLYYCLWNMIPFGGLDGIKLFLGSALTYSLILMLSLLMLLIVIF